jgi:8-oxo-dGTP pyrophosphatase MutT (NUDIX family)
MSRKERFKTICAVYLLLIKEGKVLLMRRCNTDYRDGYYDLPAGHLEKDESLTEAIIRESQEEVGLNLDPEKAELVHVMHWSEIDPSYIYFFFSFKDWEGTPKIEEPEKCDDLRWFNLNDLPKNIIPCVHMALKEIHRPNLYTEYSEE